MGLLQRLMGEPAQSREDLQRQADEEIKQMMGKSSGPVNEEMGRDERMMEEAPSEEAGSR